MKMSVIGCGYLGAVHAAAMASLGHEVVGIDVDPAKIEALAAGQAPFFEPGLPELLTEAMATGRLRFASDIAAAQLCGVGSVAATWGYGTVAELSATGADHLLDEPAALLDLLVRDVLAA